MVQDVKPMEFDVHPSVPGMNALLPYLDPHWQEQVTDRGITTLDSISYPTNLEFTARPDLRKRGLDFDGLTGQVFDQWGAGRAILNCLYGVQLVHNLDMAVAFHPGTERLDQDRVAQSRPAPSCLDSPADAAASLPASRPPPA